MNRRESAAMAIHAIPTLGLMLQGNWNVTTPTFMPYHSEALGCHVGGAAATLPGLPPRCHQGDGSRFRRGDDRAADHARHSVSTGPIVGTLGCSAGRRHIHGPYGVRCSDDRMADIGIDTVATDPGARAALHDRRPHLLLARSDLDTFNVTRASQAGTDHQAESWDVAQNLTAVRAPPRSLGRPPPRPTPHRPCSPSHRAQRTPATRRGAVRGVSLPGRPSGRASS